MTATRKQLSTLLVVCALVLGATSVMRTWFSAHGLSAGLWGIEDCSRGCHGVRWDNVTGTDFDIVLAGYTATVAGLVAAVMMLLCGLLAAGTSGERGPLRAARTTLTVALVAIGYFVMRFLIDGHLGADWGVVAGPLAAIGGAVALRRL